MTDTLSWLDRIADDLRGESWCREGEMIVTAAGLSPLDVVKRKRLLPSQQAVPRADLMPLLGWSPQQYHAVACAEANATWGYGDCCAYPERHKGLHGPVRSWLEATCQ